MKRETIRSSLECKKREYFISSISCNLAKWMDLDMTNDDFDRGTRSRHLRDAFTL